MAITAIKPQKENEQARKPLARADTQFNIVARRFRRHRLAMVSLLVLGVILVASILAKQISPFERDYLNVESAAKFLPPLSRSPETGAMHWLGTNQIGQDLFTRLVYAARISLTTAILATTLSTLVGTILGTLAGYFRGILDSVIQRVIDFFSNLPQLPILLILTAVLVTDPRLIPIPTFVIKFLQAIMLFDQEREARVVAALILILTLLGWTGVARLMRGQVLQVRERDFVEGARALGANSLAIITRHIVPNAFPPVIVAFTLGLAASLTAETGLSFLGVGIQNPVPTWGNMLAFTQSYMFERPYLPLIPAFPMFLCSVAFNFIGDGLRDALDPRQTK
ncbi:MAG TPA: ABC transporter permease [Thermoflexales bacterium]|nr:ABC transporter permease [Thermoflexales bacterium]HQX12420.1 ABC transporter permease [Thermoflexales bacterium]HRA55737.1 ABC transporter permease [Thermoflexales bacterium]